MSNFTNIHIRILQKILSYTLSSLTTDHLLSIEACVEATVLTEGHRVLDPLMIISDEVDGDMFPVIIVTRIHSQRITAQLSPVPEMPGQLEIVPAPHYLVIYRSIISELSAHSVILIGCFIRETVLLRSTIESDSGSEKASLISVL